MLICHLYIFCRWSIFPIFSIKKSGSFFKVFLRFYLLICRQRGREGERKGERETSMCGWLSHTLYWGPGPQPRHVPWLGIKQASLPFSGQYSVHWATPVRAIFYYILVRVLNIYMYILHKSPLSDIWLKNIFFEVGERFFLSVWLQP